MIAKIYRRFCEPEVWEKLRFLEASQFWSRDVIQAHQFEKLKKLLIHAHENVPYYRGEFQKIGLSPAHMEMGDFRNLPILTKEIIRQNFSSLKATNMSPGQFIPNSTGGSTGEPLHFFQDASFHSWADAARLRGWYQLPGFAPGESCGVVWGAAHEIKEDYTLHERLNIFFTTGEIPLNAFRLSAVRINEFLRWCWVVRPKLLRGYVSAIKELARYLESSNKITPPFQAVVLCAETVDNSTREFIEKVFKAPCFNTYGGRELSLIAMGCHERNGLHEISENNMVELEPIELPGYEKAGNVIVTNLNNYAMPFIRYRIGDIAIPSQSDRCACGRGLPLIERIIGRSTEVFKFFDGTSIAGEMFIHLMKDFKVREYQFVQVSQSRVVLRLQKAEEVSESVLLNILETYGKFLPQGVSLDVEFVQEFEKSMTGKFRFVYRQSPQSDM